MVLRSKLTTEALQGLKNTQLKQIAEKCGWSIGSTKRLLIESIVNGSTKSNFSNAVPSASGKKSKKKEDDAVISSLELDQHRVLSIDMGIKNLALCLLSISDKYGFSKQKSQKLKDQTRPRLLAWERFSVLDRVQTISHDHAKNAEDDDSSVAKKSKDLMIDAAIFQPANFAPIVTGLVRDLLDKYKPTLILIERQRHRSMGGASIQEWTVRVNMFEAMLHAIIRMLIEDGHWKGGKVVSISPQRMTSFWLSNVVEVEIKHEDITPIKKISKSARSKLLKVRLVRKMLEGHDAVVLEDGNQTIGHIVKQFETLGSKKKKSGSEVEKQKLDDLSDCLLQGLAAIEWEKNRRLVVEGNFDVN